MEPVRHPPRPAPPRPVGVTIYGCQADEATLVLRLASSYGLAPIITEAGVTEANVDLAVGNRCISIGHRTPVRNYTLLALSQIGVKYISTRSVGYNHIDLRYARSLGITVENVAYSPDSVADFTLMLILMAVRNARSIVQRVDGHDYGLPDRRGRELRDLTVGIVGTGRIGTAVMIRLHGFGARTVAYDPRPRTDAEYVPLDELVGMSDVVTLHVPLDEGSHHLLDRRRIGLMKPGAILVNTARGGIVDTSALLSSLETGRLAGAALDVVEGEDGIFYTDCRNGPVPNQNLLQLQARPDVVITPHTAYYTDRSLSDMVAGSLANCSAYEEGRHRG
ncbi:MAG TPA: NAD(P)-dependent oxidoreductase [Acidimicrobiales bacterium]|nr:NAD(P)-dependent oxidoreductase [Acidimicrobiales bacterium]